MRGTNNFQVKKGQHHLDWNFLGSLCLCPLADDPLLHGPITNTNGMSL